MTLKASRLTDLVSSSRAIYLRRNMNRKFRYVSFILCIILLLCACGKDTPPSSDSPSNKRERATATPTNTPEPTSAPTEVPTPVPNTPTPTAVPAPAPNTPSELYECILTGLKNHDATVLNEYLSEDLEATCGEDTIGQFFLDLLNTYGDLKRSETKPESDPDGEPAYFCSILELEHAYALFQLTVTDMRIIGASATVQFKNSFDLSLGNGITESYFSLSSHGYELNAVYTHPEGQCNAAVLLIPGSGPSDHNEAIGFIAPFRDIAIGLANQGISSLRVEKRTNRFGSEYTDTCTIQNEYIEDYTAALEWLQNTANPEKLFLLGHSLGAQIAPVIAESNPVDGLILFNGTARHFADVLYDQYLARDYANAAGYKQLTDIAKAATPDNLTGQFCYGASDMYWADYNTISVVDSLNRLQLPTLIINSTTDGQLFDSDIDFWKDTVADKDYVSFRVFDDINHYGYHGSLSDLRIIYTVSPMPDELLTCFGDFIHEVR